MFNLSAIATSLQHPFLVVPKCGCDRECIVQSNLNSSNTDGSFTMANTNSFLSGSEILLIAQENKYSGKFSYFIMKLYVVCTH